VTYTVDGTNGTDAGTCIGASPSTECKTIQYVFTNEDLDANDIVEVEAGTYSETVTFGTDDGGTSGNPVILRGKSGDTVIIDGGDVRWQGIDLNNDLTPDAPHYITIQNLNIQNINNASGRGIDAENVDGLTVTGVTFDDIDGSAAYAIYAKACNTANIYSNTFSSGSESSGAIYYYGNTFNIYLNTFTGSNYESAIYIASTTVTGNIYSNTFTNVNATGTLRGDGHIIGLFGGTTNSRTIDTVNIYDNTATGCGEKSRGGLISVYNSEDINIYRNSLTGNNTTCITAATNVYDIQIYMNRCTGNTLNADQQYTNGMIEIEQAIGGCGACLTLDTVNVYNNTISNNDDANSPTGNEAGVALVCADVAGHTFQNVNVKNNIVNENLESAGAYGWELYVSFGSNPTISNVTLANNDYYRDGNTDYFIYYDGNSYTYAQFSTPTTGYQDAESQDANSIDDDPLFVSETTDYHLQSGSPAKNTGVDVGITLDLDQVPTGQGGFDMGCYEFDTATIRAITISQLIR
jgi:hypothetical protein